MDPISLATQILTAIATGGKLAADAIDASRAGDDAKALASLDDALAHLAAAMPGLQADLLAVKARVQATINAKFPETNPKAL